MTTSPKWPTKSLAELAEFRNGINYNKNNFGEGIKVVGVKDFQDYTKPKYENLEQINHEGVITKRNVLRDGDIVFVRSNGNRNLIGRSLYIMNPPEDITHSAFTIRLRFTSHEVFPRFYAYLFRTPFLRGALSAYGNGTNISNLNQDILNQLEVPLPSLSIQRRIAGILSAYDDLIENNLQRIKILEEMARSFYREWFVHFRFPSHQKIPLVNSPLGKIPKDWKIEVLSSLVDFAKGRKPTETRQNALNGDVKLLLIDSLHGGKAMFTSPIKLILAEIRDTIMVMDGASSCEVTIGSSGAVGSTLGRFRTINPKIFSPHALYRFFEAKAEEFKTKNIGSAIPHANKDYILRQQIVLPPEIIMIRFHEQLEPIQSKIDILKTKIQNLRQTRDLLLPRLLSGNGASKTLGHQPETIYA